jgi:hypothetical protein
MFIVVLCHHWAPCVVTNKFLLLRILLHFLPILKLDFIPLRYLVDYAAEIILLFFSRKRMPRFIYGCAYWAFCFLFRCARINIFTYMSYSSLHGLIIVQDYLNCDHFDLLGTNGMKEVAVECRWEQYWPLLLHSYAVLVWPSRKRIKNWFCKYCTVENFRTQNPFKFHLFKFDINSCTFPPNFMHIPQKYAFKLQLKIFTFSTYLKWTSRKCIKIIFIDANYQHFKAL